MKQRTSRRYALVLLATSVACGSRSQMLGGQAAVEEGEGGSDGYGSTGGMLSVAGVPAQRAGSAGHMTGGDADAAGTAGKATGGAAAVSGASFGGERGLAGEMGEEAGGSAGDSTSSAAGGASAGEAPAGGAGGAEPEAPAVTWAKRFGDQGARQWAKAIAVEPSGDFAITGSFAGGVDFGDGAWNSPGDDLGMYLAKFDTDAALQWSAAYGQGTGWHYPLALDVDGNGGLAVSGTYVGTLDFGGGELVTSPGYDAFLASFDADGGYRAAQRFGDPNGSSGGTGVAWNGYGGVSMVGRFAGAVDLGGGKLSSAGGEDGFLAGFDGQLKQQWSQRVGDDQLQLVSAVTHASSDNSFIMVGDFAGTMRINACSQMTSKGALDIWVGWVSASGDCLASVRAGDAEVQRALAVTSGRGGISNTFAVAGLFRGTLDVNGPVQAIEQNDAYVLGYWRDAGFGSIYPAWTRHIGGPGSQVARALSTDYQDNVIVVGDYTGSVPDVGLPEADDSDVFVVKLSWKNDLIWALRLGGPGVQHGYAVGTDQNGNIYVAGSFEQRLELEGGDLISAGGDDIFVVKLPP